MKVLHISSGNAKNKISPIVKRQVESLQNKGMQVNVFPVIGKGIFGYLKNILPLKKHLQNTDYQIIHAHYGLSGWVALLAFTKLPIIVSFMGDDLIGVNKPDGSYTLIGNIIVKINRFLVKNFYSYAIVKSNQMAKGLPHSKVVVIPNGVNTEQFKPYLKNLARDKTQLDRNKKYVIFVSNPKREEKNYVLAQKAVKKLNDNNIQLLVVTNVEHKELVWYYNSADVLLLTSFHEGSPNVIKEAMACNCPVVSTNVGDVKWVIGNTAGCYITTFEPEDVADKIKKAIEFSTTLKKTQGRKRIIELGIDSEAIADKLIQIYNKIQNK